MTENTPENQMREVVTGLCSTAIAGVVAVQQRAAAVKEQIERKQTALIDQVTDLSSLVTEWQQSHAIIMDALASFEKQFGQPPQQVLTLPTLPAYPTHHRPPLAAVE